MLQGEILTNRCTSADDLLQGLIEFIRFCLPGLSLSLSLSLAFFPLTANPQYLALFFLFFIDVVYFFWLVRSSIPTLRSCILLKLETANGARFSLHAAAILPSPFSYRVQPSAFPLRVAAFYFHFSGEATERYRYAIGRLVGNDFSIGPAPVYFIPCQFVSSRTQRPIRQESTDSFPRIRPIKHFNCGTALVAFISTPILFLLNLRSFFLSALLVSLFFFLFFSTQFRPVCSTFQEDKSFKWKLFSPCKCSSLKQTIFNRIGCLDDVKYTCRLC